MKSKIIPVLVLTLLAALVFFAGCKKSEETDEFTLTVLVSEGVTGTPAAGVYTYHTKDKISYSYALESGYSDLKVLLDSSSTTASGTITMAADRTLQAYSSGHGQWVLTTTVAEGVNGSPAAGTVTYDEGQVVTYSYTLADGYTSLAVTLDGETVTASGTITMSANHTLAVTASKKKSILGSWTLSEAYTDGSSFSGTITFTGTLAAGTVTDTTGGSGTYTVTDNVPTFTLLYPNVTYTYTGSFSSDSVMSGTCKRAQSSTSYYTGTWSATLVTTSQVSQPAARGRKGTVDN